AQSARSGHDESARRQTWHVATGTGDETFHRAAAGDRQAHTARRRPGGTVGPVLATPRIVTRSRRLSFHHTATFVTVWHRPTGEIALPIVRCQSEPAATRSSEGI